MRERKVWGAVAAGIVLLASIVWFATWHRSADIDEAALREQQRQQEWRYVEEVILSEGGVARWVVGSTVFIRGGDSYHAVAAAGAIADLRRVLASVGVLLDGPEPATSTTTRQS